MQKTVQNDAKLSGGKLKNTMVSPISAYAALSMLQSGLSGQTKSDLLHSMNLENSAAVGLDHANKALLDSLRIARKGGELAVDCANKAPEKKSDDFRPKPPVVGIYNSAWGTSYVKSTQKPFAFAPDFVSGLKENYSAEVRTDLDFRTEGAAKAINGWAEQKTNCLIPKVITEDQLKDLIWVLMNATYLEASWENGFYNVVPDQAPKFNTLDGRKIAAPMIRSTDYMNSVTTDEYVAVEIPFYTESREDDLAFIVLMPHDSKQFAAQSLNGALFSEKVWKGLLNDLKAASADQKRIELQMPKFSFGYSMIMQKNEPLTQAVKLNFLFEDGMARAKDFLTLGTPSSVVGIIKQDTKIELDEKGVKAAAVTLIGGIERTAIPARPIPVVIDKPFAFAIGSKSKGALLFIGSVVDPTVN